MPDFANIKEIFDRAAELASDEQAAYLAEACAGDAELLLEVQQLLGHDADETAVSLPDLDRIRAEVAAQNQRRQTLVGQKIGSYEITEQIGQGGMGDVYLASRTSDYESRVAIKVTRPHVASEMVLNRFREEIQIQASLGKHPNIAAMLDAGETDDGLPYFVMDYVDGVRIDTYCDTQRLSTQARIKLFLNVCSAVQFAHQNAILHRDLKPSNILVTQEGVPVLIDFGIAKTAVDEGENTRTIVPIFTPDYASPEQVRGLPLTTSSDVYSLGVVFYEMLTGHRPYQLRSHLPHKLVEAIDQQTPVRPSEVIERIDTLQCSDGTTRQVTPDSVSHQRSVPIARLRKTLRGDLDTIVLMALRKEPERRYPTADQLASDLDCYLKGMPVVARGDTVGYRAKKFVARNKVAATLGALVLLSLCGGLLGTGLGFADARRQRDDAEQSLAFALESVDRMLLRVGNDDLADIPQVAEVRREILEDALEFYNGFLQQREDDTRIAKELGRANVLVGSIYEKLYRLEEALEAYQNGIDCFEAFLADGRSDYAVEEKLAGAHLSRGVVLADQRKYDEAIESYERALDAIEKSRRKFPNTPDLIDTQASIMMMLAQITVKRDPVTGESIYRDAVGMQETLVDHHPNVFPYQTTLALLYTDLGFFVRHKHSTAGLDEAEQLQQKALAIRKRIMAAFPHERSARRRVASTLKKLGRVYHDDNRFQKAIDIYQEAIPIQERLVSEYPGYPTLKSELAGLYGNVGAAKAGLGDYAAGKQGFGTAAAVFRELVAAYPDVPAHRADLGGALRSLAHIHNELSDAKTADALFAEELEIAKYLAAEYPEEDSYRESLTLALAKLADRQERNNDADEAAKTREQALAAGGHSAETYFHRGRNFARKRKYERAIEDFGKAIDLDPTKPAWFAVRGDAYRNLDQPEKAIADYIRVTELAPDDASAFRRIGSCYRDMGKHVSALEYYAQAIRIKPDYATAYNSQGLALEKLGRLEDAAQSFTSALNYIQSDRVVWENRGVVYLKQKRWPAAIADFTQALKIKETARYYEARAYAKRKLGKYESAISDYTAALNKDDRMLDAIHGRAWAQAELENWDLAERDYARAVSVATAPSPKLQYERALVGLPGGKTNSFATTCRSLLKSIAAKLPDDDIPPPLVPHMTIAVAADGIPTPDANILTRLLQRRIDAVENNVLDRIAAAMLALNEGRDETALMVLQSIADSDTSEPEEVAIARLFLAEYGVISTEQLVPSSIRARTWNRRLLVQWIQDQLDEAPKRHEGEHSAAADGNTS